MELALARTDHRPWPIPAEPWRWHQTWLDRLFLHFEVDPDILRTHIPPGLEMDLHGGNAWIGALPFRCDQTTIRGIPSVPVVPAFDQVVVRTYVSRNGKPGVWFFNLEVNSRQAVLAAQAVFNLAYRLSTIETKQDTGGVLFRQRREERSFAVRYRPTGPATAEPGSFEHWCTERYCFYSQDGAGRLYRADIHHQPWELEAAEAEVLSDALLADHAPGAMHPNPVYARRQEVVIWPARPVN